MAEQQVAVVTGGTRGIGRAICISLAKMGMRVYFNYSSQDDSSAKEVERQLAEIGVQSKSARVNVASAEEVNAFFKMILEEAGQIDVLVNNAGITRDGLIARMKEDQWDAVLDINLKGAFLCAKAVTKPMMKQKKGRIINISSVVGAAGNPGQANYVASKAGIIGFTKAIALELASRNITANVVAPGFIETDMTTEMSEKAKQKMLTKIPLGRAGSAKDVAGAVVFLASKEADYITGQVIHVNGGMYM